MNRAPNESNISIWLEYLKPYLALSAEDVEYTEHSHGPLRNIEYLFIDFGPRSTLSQMVAPD